AAISLFGEIAAALPLDERTNQRSPNLVYTLPAIIRFVCKVMLRFNFADGAGFRTHHDRVSISTATKVTNPLEVAAVGDASGDKHHIAFGEIGETVNFVLVLDPHAFRAFTLFIVTKLENAL